MIWPLKRISSSSIYFKNSWPRLNARNKTRCLGTCLVRIPEGDWSTPSSILCAYLFIYFGNTVIFFCYCFLCNILLFFLWSLLFLLRGNYRVGLLPTQYAAHFTYCCCLHPRPLDSTHLFQSCCGDHYEFYRWRSDVNRDKLRQDEKTSSELLNKRDSIIYCLHNRSVLLHHWCQFDPHVLATRSSLISRKPLSCVLEISVKKSFTLSSVARVS